MNAYKVFAAFTLIVVTLSACGTTPTPIPPTPPALIPNAGATTTTTIGTVNTMQNHVQAGPLGKLSAVPISQTLYSDDAVRVIDGGVALLNFFDQIALKLFNDSSVGGVNVEVLESTNKRVRMKLERGGLSGQVAKESGGADFEIANGVHIYILGTQFYVTYDPAANIVSAGNFDGTVGYQLPGQSPQMLPAGSLIDILPGGVVQLSNMSFDINAFDAAAQTDGSPLQGLKNLRATSATLTPTPANAITPTPLPTSCPIPVGWRSVVVQPADTLNTIASRYITTAEILMQGNCLNTPNLITGTIIYAPPLSAATPCSHPAGWVTYIVQSGETLYQIGLKYGVTAATLQSGNCMGYAFQIYAGQILYVPNVATSTPGGITISGNAGVAYATLSYTDGIAKVAITDGSGNYAFTVSYNWSGTVTPYQTGYTFSPVSIYYSNVFTNQTAQNYTATGITYVISGFVNRASTGGGVEGVTITYTGSTSGETRTYTDGDYLFTVPYGWSGTVTPSKTGYTFSPANKSYTNVLANQTGQNYTAFPNPYALTVSKSGTGSGTVTSSPSGINCGSTCSANFNYNTSVTLTATAATGSTFTGWSGACAGIDGPNTNGICTVTIDAAKSVTANFTLNPYALTVGKSGTGSGTITSSPSGINCGSTCSANFNYNASVTLTATPAADSTFTGWSGACTVTSGTCTVTMDAAKSVTVNFTLKTYTISGNAGVAGATLSYTDGTAKTAIADGNGNYSFVVSYNWSGTVTPSKIGYTFTPANKSYTNVLANQTAQNYTATASASSDTPTSFQNGSATTEICNVIFTVTASDPDGIRSMEAYFSIKDATGRIFYSSTLGVPMSQIQNFYQGSTILTTTTGAPDTIIYYFQSVDMLGRMTKSGSATINAGSCPPLNLTPAPG